MAEVGGEEFDALEASRQDDDAGRTAGGLAGVTAELGNPLGHFSDGGLLSGRSALPLRPQSGRLDFGFVKLRRRRQVRLRPR